MTHEDFWSLIDQSEADADSLKQVLRKRTVDDVVAFYGIFRQLFHAAYRWDLWGAAYLIEGGCSNDGFMDFRYGLIAQGKSLYTQALADPDSLADVSETVCLTYEAYGYVAVWVYEDKTGSDEIPCSDTWPRAPGGEKWDFDDFDENARRLPRLSAQHSN